MKAAFGFLPSHVCCFSAYFFPHFPPCYSSLYDEIICLCVDLGELDAAVAVVADLETTGILVSDQTLDRVISAKQRIDNTSNGVITDAGL